MDADIRDGMQNARPILRLAVGSATLIVTVLGPGLARAQADASENGGMRSAGDDARFRVIDRFPDDASESDAPRQEDLELAISEQLAEAIRKTEWKRAARLFDRRIGEKKPSHAFLHGYIAWKRERWGAARKRFDAAADRWSLLDDYSAYFAAAAALEAGDHHGAVVRAARVPTSSRLFGDALAVMAEALTNSETGVDRRRALRVAARYLDHFPDGANAARMRLMLGRLHLEEQDFSEAADRLFGLLKHHPLSEEAETAEKLLAKHRESLSETDREKLDERPKALQLAYLRALYESHASEKVIEEGRARIDAWTPGGRARCQTLYWIARSHTKLKHHEKATEWYQRVLDECAGVSPYERKALYVGGKGFWNAGQKQTALEWFERMWTRYEDHSYADDGMYFAARIYRELDKSEQASELLSDQVERYPNGDMAADAHWLQVRQMFRREQYDRVVAYVDRLEASGERELSTRGRLAYFQARALEMQEKSKKAREHYLAVAQSHPLTLYALYALNRIARIDDVGRGQDFCGAVPAVCEDLTGGEETKSDESGPTLPRRVRSDAAYQRGAALLRLGIREWASREFDLLFDHYAGNDEALLALADLLDRAGAHGIAYSLPEQLEGWRERYPAAGDRRAWTIAYPKAFPSSVAKWANKRELPTSLVWAIIRKESGYDPTIESWANARGLMQLMEGTAEDVADEIGFGRVEATDLLTADSNIRLGTAYLADLSSQLDGHLALMAAGYNGGYGNVRDWLEARGDLPLDLWIEDIPYGQTRRYAKVVLASDWTYRWLYEGKAVPRLTFDISGVVD